MQALANWISQFLNNPLKVIFWCCLFAIGSLLFNGNLIRLYKLNRDTALLTEQIQQTIRDIAVLDRQMLQAKDPAYLGRQAMDLYDFAEEDDLVFVFSE